LLLFVTILSAIFPSLKYLLFPAFDRRRLSGSAQ